MRRCGTAVPGAGWWSGRAGCVHSRSALSRDSQVALTLRLMCGLTTPEIAAGLLVRESAVAARITRAKKKIMAAGIPFSIPGDAELRPRLDVVLTVIHLAFTTGHTAAGEELSRGRVPGADLPGVLRELDELATDSTLDAYAYLPATRADVLARLGRREEARTAYDAALLLTHNENERRFLRRRRAFL
ncbi:MAG: sigma factor-like helix-turn-helix DNA-binding protein [Nocardioidaceae bacterium]